MSLANVAVLGSQTVLGVVGLGVGGAKVTHQADQIEEFQRYGYPQWFRVLTGVLELGAGTGMLVALLWRPELSVVGGLLLSGVMAGAVVTHLRIGDPLSKTAVPALVFTLTVTLLACFPNACLTSCRHFSTKSRGSISIDRIEILYFILLTRDITRSDAIQHNSLNSLCITTTATDASISRRKDSDRGGAELDSALREVFAFNTLEYIHRKLRTEPGDQQK